MPTMSFWLFKWRAAGGNQRWNGDFTKVLPKARGFRARGFESPRCASLWKKIRARDIVFCYQSERRDIVGVAKVVRMSIRNGLRHVDLKPLRHSQTPINIHACKRQHPKLRAADCLQQGSMQTIYRVTIPEAKLLAEVCRVKAIIGRSWQRRALEDRQELLTQPTGSLAAAPPPPPCASSPRSVSEWGDILLDRHDGKLRGALIDAKREIRRSAYGTPERPFWKAVCAQLRRGSPAPEGSTVRALNGLKPDGGLTTCPVCSCSILSRNLASHQLERCPGPESVRITASETGNPIAKSSSGPKRDADLTTCPACDCSLLAKNLLLHQLHKCPLRGSMSKKVPKRQHRVSGRKRKGKVRWWNKKKRKLNFFARGHGWGQGQTRKVGSHRDNRGHR